jgi:hypothetical protein
MIFLGGCSDRLRLREEVEILQHLSYAAVAATGQGQEGLGRHPNVLAYVDSWEEDAHLFIRTELCELGNFARFLWDYGRVFPRLDEARVWKIVADLSNVGTNLPYLPCPVLISKYFSPCFCIVVVVVTRRDSGLSMTQGSFTWT